MKVDGPTRGNKSEAKRDVRNQPTNKLLKSLAAVRVLVAVTYIVALVVVVAFLVAAAIVLGTAAGVGDPVAVIVVPALAWLRAVGKSSCAREG